MKKGYRLMYFLLCFGPVLLAPTMLSAQSPFDGTWRTNMDQAKFSPKPIIFSLKDGTYDCSSCSPKIDIKANGQDQSVSGQAYDTLSVSEVDSKSIKVVAKKNTKPEFEQTRSVSGDGNTLTVKTTSYPQNGDQPVTSEATATRTAKGTAGANETSGSWRIDKLNESDNGVLTTYKTDGDGMSMSTPVGETYTAKLDGKDYPTKGIYGYDSVSLKRVNDHTIEETDKRGGKVIEVSKMTVSADGKKMTIVSTSKLTGRVSTFVAEKQ